MLNEIRLRNFKSIKGAKIPLAPLTVLAGLNGSGKSSVLQSLALLKQSVDLWPKADRLVLRGGLVQLGRSEDVHFEGAKEGVLSIGVSSSEGSFDLQAPIAPALDTLDAAVEGDVSLLTSSFEGFQFIQADRLTPALQFLQASTPAQEAGWLGCRGEFTVDYLHRNGDEKISKERCYRNHDGRLPSGLFEQVAPTDSLLDQTSAWLQLLSPGVKLRPSSVDLADISLLRFEYTGTGLASQSREHRPTNVGFGLTYCLPIVVACLSASRGSLLLLENPEAHLHPRGQFALGQLLAVCAADDVQIIVETHSDHLLNGIRVAAKRSQIPSNKVAAHFFSRDIETGATSVESPHLSDNGRFDDWPEGFFDEWSKALDELLED